MAERFSVTASTFVPVPVEVTANRDVLRAGVSRGGFWLELVDGGVEVSFRVVVEDDPACAPRRPTRWRRCECGQLVATWRGAFIGHRRACPGPVDYLFGDPAPWKVR